VLIQVITVYYKIIIFYLLECFWLMDKFLNYTLDYSEVPFQGRPGNDNQQDELPTRLEGISYNIVIFIIPLESK